MKNVITKKKTLIIAKIKDSEQLVGGYNPSIWDRNGSWRNGKDRVSGQWSVKHETAHRNPWLVAHGVGAGRPLSTGILRG